MSEDVKKKKPGLRWGRFLIIWVIVSLLGWIGNAKQPPANSREANDPGLRTAYLIGTEVGALCLAIGIFAIDSWILRRGEKIDGLGRKPGFRWLRFLIAFLILNGIVAVGKPKDKDAPSQNRGTRISSVIGQLGGTALFSFLIALVGPRAPKRKDPAGD